MKHCKTLFVLVTAAIVMLTSGCARQTVHPVPIRYNFLDHIPDADPMLLDTEAVSAPHSIVPKSTSTVGFGMQSQQPVPIRYRFAVPQSPDPDPLFPGNDLVLAKALEVRTDAGLTAQRKTPVPIRYRFAVPQSPDPDPLFPGDDLVLAETFEVGTDAGLTAQRKTPVPIRYRFAVPQSPDPDPLFPGNDLVLAKALAMGTVAGLKARENEPSGIRFQFVWEAIADADPMLQVPASGTNFEKAPKAAIAAATPSGRFRFVFITDATPDPDPMLTGNGPATTSQPGKWKAAVALGYRIPAIHPAPIRYRFDVTPIPDHDPLLQQTESMVGKTPIQRNSSLTASSGAAGLYR